MSPGTATSPLGYVNLPRGYAVSRLESAQAGEGSVAADSNHSKTTFQEHNMKKLIAALIATAFASGVAFAQDKKKEEMKSDAKPAAAAPAKKDEKAAAPAAKKEAAPAAKKDEKAAAPAAKKEEKKTEAKK